MKKAMKYIQNASLIFLAGFICLSLITASLMVNGPRKASAAALMSGPTLPYVEVQAEDASTNGTIIGPDRIYPSLATEAIERKAVTLDTLGEYVEFTVPQTANSIVMRYSIPDANDGSGLTAPLGLYINGNQQPDLSLTSKYAWYYGNYPFTNNPADIRPHHFYDEVHLLTTQLNPGDTVRVQVDAGSTAPSYTIDLMDFEQVAGALTQPVGSLSLTEDFSADATGAVDSATALQTAVNAAAAQAKLLWIPSGTYQISGQIHIPDDVTIQGAGMWYATLHFTAQTGNNAGLYGSFPTSNFHAADFAILGEVQQRNDGDQINGFGGGFSNSTIERIWIEHTKVGAWLDGPFTNLSMSNLIIRNVAADGVNFHQAVTDSTVTQSFLRNTGDDALAMWTHGVDDSGNTFSFNRVEMPVLANGIAIYGGKDNNVTDNYVGDQQAEGGGIHVGNRFSSVPASGTINILRNTIVRAGSKDSYNGWNYGTGALWFFSLEADLTATIHVEDNTIIDSNYEAIHFTGSHTISNISFNHNQIIGTGTFGIESRVDSGSVTVSNTDAFGLGTGGYYQKPSSGTACGAPSFIVTDGGGNVGLDLTPTCQTAYPDAVYGVIPTATPTLTSTACPGGLCATLTPTQTRTPTTAPVVYVRIKNKANNTYLYEDNNTVKYGLPASTDAASHWLIEDFAGHQRIKNRATGNYMAIQDELAYVQSISVCDACTSGQWDVTDASNAGYKNVRNIWHPWQILNNAQLTGYAEYTADSTVPVTENSAQWALETAPAPIASTPTPQNIDYVRIKNKWQNTYLYEDNEKVKYGTPAETDATSHWEIQDFGGHKRIKNRATGNYMAIENLLAYVQSIQVCDVCGSGQWDITDASSGYKTLRNVWHPWQIINVEQLTGYAEYTSDVTVPTTNDSAQWAFETAPAPVIPTPLPGSNLALNMPIFDSAHAPGQLPNKANDGNINSYWEGLSYPNMLTVDLGSIQSVSVVRLKINPAWAARTQHVEIQISDDNASYTQLLAAADYNLNPDATIQFTPVSTRYIRLIFTSNSAAANGQVAEFEVYENLPVEATITPTPTITPTLAPVHYVRIKNKAYDTYLYEDSNTVKYGTPLLTDTSAQWVLEDFSGHTRIKNRATGNYINIQNLLAYVESGSICDACSSGQWDISDASNAGYKVINSVYHGWQNLTVKNQTGYAEYTEFWLSPVTDDVTQWMFEDVPEPATPTPTPTATEVPVNYIRIKNKGYDNYLYEDSNTVKYGTPLVTDTSSQWVLEDYSGHTRIKNRATGNYMNIEHLAAYVESGPVCDVCSSGQWDIVDASNAGYKVLTSVYHGWQNLTEKNQTGYAEYTEFWLSPVTDDVTQWMFEPVGGPATATATVTVTPTLTMTTAATATPTVTRTTVITPTPTKTVTPTATSKPVFTLTFNSTSAEDGWVLESGENSNVGGSMAPKGNLIVGDDASNRQYRSIVSFNTNSLPNNAQITSAVLKIKQNGAAVGVNPFTALGNMWVDIRLGTFGSPSLQLNDFSAFASALQSSAFHRTPADGWYSNTLNAIGLGKINKVGLTQFRLRFALDDNNNHAMNYLKFFSGDSATNKPQLVITYIIP